MALKLTGTFGGWKQHRCTDCGALYRYQFGGSAAVVALDPKRRQAKLRAVLDRLRAAALEWRACPQCGTYQPDMVAQRRRFWAGWTCLAVWLGVDFLVIISVQDQLTVPTLTVAATGYWALCAAVLAWTAWRNFNADPARNRAKAAAFTAAGTLRLDEPGTVEASIPPSASHRGQRAGVVFAVLLALTVMLPTLPEGTRRTAGWPLNPAFFPPVAGPGDQTTFHLPGTIRCVHGYWRGQAQARLLNAKELGLSQDKLTAVTNDYRWAKDLSVSANQPDYDIHPWVTFTLPANVAPAGWTARVELKLHALFPELSGQQTFGDFTFVTGERDLAATAVLMLAAPGASRTYQWLWYGGMAGSAMLLTAAARRLRKTSRREGQSTQTGTTSPQVS